MTTTDYNNRLSSVNSTSHSTKPWRLIRKGLNIEGLCLNYRCSAYNQMVIINLGYGEFDFARIILARPNHCPSCKQIIYPTKFALTNCRWWYVNHYTTHLYPLHTIGNTYKLHDLPREYLIIETMPLLQANQSDSNIEEIVCSICLGDMQRNENAIALQCSHNFHENCIFRWFESNQSMAHYCPICRVNISTMLTN